MRRFIFDLIFPRRRSDLDWVRRLVKGRGWFRVLAYPWCTHARGCPRNRNALLSIWVGKHVDPYSGRHPPRVAEGGGGTGSLGGGPVVVRRGHAKTRVLLAGHDFSGKREYPIGAFYLSFRFVETKQFSNCNILFSSNFCWIFVGRKIIVRRWIDDNGLYFSRALRRVKELDLDIFLIRV